jgi:hypothetical protein
MRRPDSVCSKGFHRKEDVMKKVQLYMAGGFLSLLTALPALSEEGQRCNVRSIVSPPVSTTNYEVETRSIHLNMSPGETEKAKYFSLVAAEQQAADRVCEELKATLEEVADAVNQQTSGGRVECNSTFQGVSNKNVSARIVAGKGEGGIQHEFEKFQIDGPFAGLVSGTNRRKQNRPAIEQWGKYVDIVEAQGINHATIQVLAQCDLLGTVSTECWEECPAPADKTVGVEDGGVTRSTLKRFYE